MTSYQRSRARGFSMIEMLIGVLIISFGLLGLITMQARALQMSIGSEDSQRAAMLANEMANMMLNLNNVNVPAAAVTAWADRVATPASGGVPNGVGTVVPVGANAAQARVTVTWKPLSAATTATNATHTYATDVVIPE